jgi:hypothetical protein
MIEADEVALVVMLIEQNLLPENLQDDKCAITKKDFFKSAGGCKNVFVARSKDRRGAFNINLAVNRGGRRHKKCNGLAEGGANLADDSWLDEALSLPTVQKLRRLRKTLEPPPSWLYKK